MASNRENAPDNSDAISYDREITTDTKSVIGEIVKTEFTDLESLSAADEYIEASQTSESVAAVVQMQYKCIQCSLRFETEESLIKHCRCHKTTFQCPSCISKFCEPQKLNEHFLQSHTVTDVNNYSCLVCETYFNREAQLKSHIPKHTHVHKHQCKYCCKTFHGSRDKTVHERVHTGEKPYKCSHCDQTFKVKRNLRVHETVHTGKLHQCDMCDKSFTTVYHLRDHMNVHNFKDSLRCKICARSLANERSLARHMQIHTSFKCTLCESFFPKRQQLEYHILAHKGMKGHECGICGRIFSAIGDLNQHKKTHIGKNPAHTCAYCKQEYTSEKNLKLHIRLHTNNYRYQCDFCDKKFNGSQQLKNHLIKHTGENPYQCKTCHKFLSSRASLKQHLRIHAGIRPFNCDYCSKRFSQRTLLQDHVNAIHLNIRRYSCIYCEMKFVTKRHLDLHIRTHTGEKPLKCEFCDKSFAKHHTLKVHMQTHSNQRNHECNICLKRFRSKSTLYIHLRIHTGDKRYKCSFCQKAFTQSSALRNHYKIHTGLRNFSCKYCSLSFKQSGHLTGHMRQKHSRDKDGNIVKPVKRSLAEKRGQKLSHKQSVIDSNSYTSINCGSLSDLVNSNVEFATHVESNTNLALLQTFNLVEIAKRYADPIELPPSAVTLNSPLQPTTGAKNAPTVSTKPCSATKRRQVPSKSEVSRLELTDVGKCKSAKQKPADGAKSKAKKRAKRSQENQNTSSKSKLK